MAVYTPILILGGLSAANSIYKTPANPAVAIKPLVGTAIAAAIAAAVGKSPQGAQLIKGIGWVALIAWLAVNATTKGSVVDSITGIVGGLGSSTPATPAPAAGKG